MNAKDLKKGEIYLYTAGQEGVPVEYMYKTRKGYKFTDGRLENELTLLAVSNHIEEIK